MSTLQQIVSLMLFAVGGLLALLGLISLISHDGP
jgi:hypothetical protein